MSIGTVFWMLMIIWLVFGWWSTPAGDRIGWGRVGLIFVLLFLLGWKEFGFVIHG